MHKLPFQSYESEYIKLHSNLRYETLHPPPQNDQIATQDKFVHQTCDAIGIAFRNASVDSENTAAETDPIASQERVIRDPETTSIPASSLSSCSQISGRIVDTAQKYPNPSNSFKALPPPLVSNQSSVMPSIIPLNIGPESAPSTPSKRPRDDNHDVLLGKSETLQNPPKRSRESKPLFTSSRLLSQHKVSHLKLAQPFRSPKFLKPASRNTMLQNPTASDLETEDIDHQEASESTLRGTNDPVITPKPRQLIRLSTEFPAFPKKVGNVTRNTKSVSKPFKSPFKSPLSSLSSSTTKSTMSPNIQALERKMQLLKRAVKIRAGTEEKNLEELITKWRSVGREVAWEIWAVVKEQGQGDNWGVEHRNRPKSFGVGGSRCGWDEPAAPGNQRKGTAFDTNWGYANPDEGAAEEDDPELVGSPSQLEAELWKCIRKTTKKPIKVDLDIHIEPTNDSRVIEETRHFGQKLSTTVEKSDNEDETDETDASAHTLGTMLRAFGVSDDILGWNDDQEDFTVCP
ncbi:hypothetical protein K439DRAFT_1183222 [Ramaria rubella]|nr:hypothetical protein K439DRAFT_1183222 [Ramaria rubella]